MFCAKCGKQMSEREEMLKDGVIHIIASCYDCNVQKDIGTVTDETTPMYNRQYVMPEKVVQEVRIKKGVNWGEILAVVIALLVIFAVLISTGKNAANSNKKTVVQNNSVKVNETNEETVTESLNKSFEIIKEYSYECSYATFHIFVIKNTSNETITVASNSTAFDSNGVAIGADGATLDVLGAGCTSMMYEYHKGVSGVASYETTITASEEELFDSVIQDIQIEKSTQPGKVIVTLTNTGTQDAEFVEAHAIFLKNGKAVHHDSSYVVDSDSCIKSGATLSEQIDCREDFDEVEVYVTGRR